VLLRLIEISRPVLWVNTIGTTVIGMWLAGYLFTWHIIPILLWVTFPFNLLIYGVNDVFDQETDNLSARKGGYEGAKIKPTEAKPILWAVALTNIPFYIYFAIALPSAAFWWMLAYGLFFIFYSAPPLRFKGRPFFDSISNTDYAFPLVFVPYALGAEPLWAAALGLMAWSMAKHVFDALQDIDQDSSVDINTTAVYLGIRRSLIWVGFWWVVSTIAFALVNWPVAIVNALIAGWLTIAVWRKPTVTEAHRWYWLSIGFPYIAGAVAGVQLVAGIVWGVYP
jgi:4-hydroxybenzoate polyprenyltransferase